LSLACLDRPFVYVVLAHLVALATKGKNKSRLSQKFAIVTRLYDAGFSEQEIINLFRFADWVMTLPPELEANFQQQLRDFEGARTMAYISSIERSGIEKGRIQERREIILKFLGQKLVGLPVSLKERVEALDADRLEDLSDVLMGFNAIDDLTAWLDSY
jgi:Domain of unknown function (DUF4351)